MKTIAIVVLSSLLLTLGGCSDGSDAERRLAEHSSKRVILALYHRLAFQAEQFQTSADHFCQSHSQPAFNDLQLRWRNLMGAWLETEVIQFGPIIEENLLWQFQFWPDKKNLVQRKVEEQLQRDTRTDIRDTSVVIQGLSALEYLLFEPSVNTAEQLREHPERCQLLRDIAQHVHDNANLLKSAWKPGNDGWHEQFMSLPDQQQEAGIPNPVSTLMVNGLHTMLERAYKKVVLPLGKTDNGNPYLAESWRSRNSLENIAANIRGARRFYDGADGFGLNDLVKASPNGNVLTIEVHQVFNQVERSLAQVPQPLSIAVTNPEFRPAVQALADDLKSLRDLFGNKIPNALGIVLSFNANDGD
ncbi:imelysin family protein [Kistimonas asteriae]|uniref:imelysin family protein n=1 Tax=Kistimonas asteriae TaxID=517724 RepID=UPI001BA6990F|nr:imelysin family protein [Kistimonas asteriae]